MSSTTDIADKKLEAALEAAFAEATRLYQGSGFQRRVGFGSKPALISVDLANAWTRPGNPFTCKNVDEQIIPSMQTLLAAFRKYNLPVVHVTTCYQITDRKNPHTDMGLWHDKIPVDVVDQKNTERCGSCPWRRPSPGCPATTASPATTARFAPAPAMRPSGAW